MTTSYITNVDLLLYPTVGMVEYNYEEPAVYESDELVYVGAVTAVTYIFKEESANVKHLFHR